MSEEILSYFLALERDEVGTEELQRLPGADSRGWGFNSYVPLTMCTVITWLLASLSGLPLGPAALDPLKEGSWTAGDRRKGLSAQSWDTESLNP